MAESPHLPEEVLIKVRAVLERVRADLNNLSEGDAKTLHHARRYVMKRLEFDERSRPSGKMPSGKLWLRWMTQRLRHN